MSGVTLIRFDRQALPFSAAALILGLVALVGCSDGSTGDPTPSATATPTQSASEETPQVPAPGGGNGALYLTDWREGQWQYQRYPIEASGKFGPAEEPVDLGGTEEEEEVIDLVDAVGSTVATAPLTDYWSTRIDLRDASDGTVAATVDAPLWCGGEGLVYNPCLLLDGDSLVRTSEIGAEDEGSVTISSLVTGGTEATWGPIEGLAGTWSAWQPGEVILALADDLMDGEGLPISSAGRILRLNASTGQTTQIGRHPAGWSAICQIGPDSVLGYQLEDPHALSVVGTESVPQVELSESDTPAGCAVDGTTLYVERLILGEDEDGGDHQIMVDSISLADGSRTNQLTLRGADSISVTR